MQELQELRGELQELSPEEVAELFLDAAAVTITPGLVCRVGLAEQELEVLTPAHLSNALLTLQDRVRPVTHASVNPVGCPACPCRISPCGTADRRQHTYFWPEYSTTGSPIGNNTRSNDSVDRASRRGVPCAVTTKTRLSIERPLSSSPFGCTLSTGGGT